jgi:hypothetical protein
MGYDDGECVMCYFWASVNDCTKNRDYLCASCVGDLIKRCGSTHRLESALKANMSSSNDLKCFFCDEDKRVVFHVSVHEGCAHSRSDDRK